MELDLSKMTEFVIKRNRPKNIIYFLFNKKNKIVYIGITDDLKRRVESHKSLNKNWANRNRMYNVRAYRRPIYKKFYKVLFLSIDDSKDISLLEQFLIFKLKPIYNKGNHKKKILKNYTEQQINNLINKYFK